MLKVSLVSKSFFKKTVLSNIDLHLKEGIIAGIMGHNGSGKSTLLKILSGEYKADAGIVSFNDKNIPRKILGILFQHKSLDEKLTVQENLEYAQRLYGPKDLDKINFILNKARLFDRKKELVIKLSGGMRRRLEIYRSFMHDPKILLLDEPTAGLDIEEVDNFYIFLKEYVSEKKAIALVSTHQAHEAKNANLLFMMNKGKIVKEGDPESFLKDLQFLNVRFTLLENIEKILEKINNLPIKLVFFDKDKNNFHYQIPKLKINTFLKIIGEEENNIQHISIEKASLKDAYLMAIKEMTD